MRSCFFQPWIVQCLGLATLDKKNTPLSKRCSELFSPYRKVVAVSRSHNNNKVKCVKWDGRGEEWDYVCHIEFARYLFFSFKKSSCCWVSDLTSNIIKTKVYNITYRLIMCQDENQRVLYDIKVKVCQSRINLDRSKVWFLYFFLSWHLNSVMCYEQTNI